MMAGPWEKYGSQKTKPWEKYALQNVPRETMPAMKGDKPGYAPTWGETGIDAIKSLGTGLGRGAIGLVGMPRDLTDLSRKGLEYGLGAMGVSPETASTWGQRAMRVSPMLSGFSNMPGSETIQNTVEGVTGKFYEPETRTGKFAGAIGEFAPAAAAGPGGLIRKAAMAVIPAVTSEGAGQAIEATGIPEAAPYARIGGALLGGVAAAGGKGSALNAMRNSADDLATVAGKTDDAYGAIDKAKIVFDQSAYKSMAMKLQTALRKHGLLVEDSGEISSTLKDIMSRTKKVNGWTEVDSMRKRMGGVVSSPTDIARAKIIKSHLDELVKSGQAKSMAGVPRDQIDPMVQKARELAQRKIIGEQIKTMEQRLPGYLSGDESAYRNQFGAYLKSPKGKTLKDAERAAFEKVVRREGLLNAAHMMGSRWGQIAGGSSTSVIGGLLGSALGPIGTVAGAALGPVVNFGATSAFRKFMDKSTQKQVDNALKTVLAGRDAQSKAMFAAQTNKAKAKLRRLLAVEPALQQGRGALLGEPVVIDAKGNQYYQ